MNFYIIFLILGNVFFILIFHLLRFIPNNPNHSKRHNIMIVNYNAYASKIKKAYYISIFEALNFILKNWEIGLLSHWILGGNHLFYLFEWPNKPTRRMGPLLMYSLPYIDRGMVFLPYFTISLPLNTWYQALEFLGSLSWCYCLLNCHSTTTSLESLLASPTPWPPLHYHLLGKSLSTSLSPHGTAATSLTSFIASFGNLLQPTSCCV